MAEAKNLSAKIAAIAKEIGAIAKDGKNEQQGYAFIEYAQVAAKARELQAKHGIAIVPTIKSYESTEVRNKYGNIGYHYLIKLNFTVVNVDDQNDQIVVDWIGEATDFGDKGINKAITSGAKYFMMRLYNISEKGEKEADNITPDPIVDKTSAPKPASKSHSKRKVDWEKVNEIKAMVKEFDDIKALQGYWKELKLSEEYVKILKPCFSVRKKELMPDEESESAD